MESIFSGRKQNKTPKLFKVFQVLWEANLEKTKQNTRLNSPVGYSFGAVASFDSRDCPKLKGQKLISQ